MTGLNEIVEVESVSQKVLITGAEGMLATDLISDLKNCQYKLYPFTRQKLDITNKNQCSQVINKIAPDIIINCAAYTQVDLCETNADKSFQVNRDGVEILASLCKKLPALLVHISTDYVFDGTHTRPSTETDITNPVSLYGQSKLAGEQVIINSLEEYLIIRTSWLYGFNGHNFVKSIMRLAKEKEKLNVVNDQFGSPTWTKELSIGIIALLQNQLTGLFHFSGEGVCSWYQLACEIIKLMKSAKLSIKTSELYPIPTSEYPTPAKRPMYSVLNQQKWLVATGLIIPNWKDSLAQFFRLYTESI